MIQFSLGVRNPAACRVMSSSPSGIVILEGFGQSHLLTHSRRFPAKAFSKLFSLKLMEYDRNLNTRPPESEKRWQNQGDPK
jgi:hypothetical protein